MPVTATPRRSGREQAILDVLGAAERPLKQAAVAARAGVRCNTYFRQLFSRLRDQGLIVRVEGPNDLGWWPKSRPVPPGCTVSTGVPGPEPSA
jgi:hypothetical protein